MNEVELTDRSATLQPLTTEHRDGLLFIWKLRQGLANNTTNDKMRAFVGSYWQNHIKPHFFQEEKILAPYLDPANPLAVKLKNDHNNIREMVLTIDREADRFDFFWLCNLLESHIRFEERELYPFIEKNLSPEQLKEIEKQLAEHPLKCENEWDDNFWAIGADQKTGTR